MLDERSLFHELILHGSRNKGAYLEHRAYGFTFGFFFFLSKLMTTLLSSLSFVWDKIKPA